MIEKLLAVIKDWEYATNVQKDLGSICEWSNDWMMQFNVSTCKVMQLRRSNSNFDCYKRDSESCAKRLEKSYFTSN